MPPAKNRSNDDTKADGPAEKKNGGTTATKMRRVASQQGSNLREVQNASTTVPAQPPAQPTAPSLQWSSFDRRSLHTYRRQYHLNTPSSYTSTFNQTVLSQPGGIGIHSPTMVRRHKDRQSKEHLALAIRKHFNGLGIQENDVIVDFIHAIRVDNAAKAEGPSKRTAVMN